MSPTAKYTVPVTVMADLQARRDARAVYAKFVELQAKEKVWIQGLALRSEPCGRLPILPIGPSAPICPCLHGVCHPRDTVTATPSGMNRADGTATALKTRFSASPPSDNPNKDSS